MKTVVIVSDSHGNRQAIDRLDAVFFFFFYIIQCLSQQWSDSI